MNTAVYRTGSLAIRSFLRLRRPSDAVTWFAQVWLRHARVARFLRGFDFDGVVDGGANVGEFAHLVREALPRADLVCVEPHPPSAQVLRAEGFRVSEAALWDRSGALSLVQPTDATTSCTVVSSESNRPRWEVRAVRLDALDVRGDRVLVKLDLQGAELKALEGMGALWDRCAALLLEVSIGPEGTYEPLRALLEARGYREYATLHELEVDGVVREADKVWVRGGADALLRNRGAR